MLVDVMKRVVQKSLGLAGLALVRTKEPVDPLCEGFDRYIKEAKLIGLDVNDYLERELGWPSAWPTLREVVFPYLSDDSCVVEVGPGTGRHARHILPKIPQGELHLYDHSTFLQSFLKSYFRVPTVSVENSDGHAVNRPCCSVDVVLSNGTFIELKLGAIRRYAEEFSRVLKPKGVAVFDYIDVSTSAGWNFLLKSYRTLPNCFTYHHPLAINSTFSDFGFELI